MWERERKRLRDSAFLRGLRRWSWLCVPVFLSCVSFSTCLLQVLRRVGDWQLSGRSGNEWCCWKCLSVGIYPSAYRLHPSGCIFNFSNSLFGCCFSFVLDLWWVFAKIRSYYSSSWINLKTDISSVVYRILRNVMLKLFWRYSYESVSWKYHCFWSYDSVSFQHNLWLDWMISDVAKLFFVICFIPSRSWEVSSEMSK